MKDSEYKFWPFKPKLTILWAIIILIGLLILFGVMRSTMGWPSDSSTNMILIGILLLSLLPILLSILDVIIDRGGIIGYKDFKIDFSKVQQSAESHFLIPANIGLRGEPVTDSGSSNILDTLKNATSTSVAVIDLGDGHEWWETRLLVLIAGAERLKRPDKIVFIATDEGKDQCFLGWGSPSNLLNCLIKGNTLYTQNVSTARITAKRLEINSNIPPFIPNAIDVKYAGIVLKNGLPNELMAEQILQSELGQLVESTVIGSPHISINRLKELFQPVLITQHVDEAWPSDRQQNTFLNTNSEWIALTNNGKYTALVSRISIMNEILKTMMK